MKWRSIDDNCTEEGRYEIHFSPLSVGKEGITSAKTRKDKITHRWYLLAIKIIDLDTGRVIKDRYGCHNQEKAILRT